MGCGNVAYCEDDDSLMIYVVKNDDNIRLFMVESDISNMQNAEELLKCN